MCIFEFQNSHTKSLSMGNIWRKLLLYSVGVSDVAEEISLSSGRGVSWGLLRQGRKQILPWSRRTRQRWQGPAAALCARTACTQPQWPVRQHPELLSCSQVGEKRAGRHPVWLEQAEGWHLEKTQDTHPAVSSSSLTWKAMHAGKWCKGRKRNWNMGSSMVCLWKCLKLWL